MTDTNENKEQTHAIILSGGGADGAYEVGVLKALFNGRSPSTDHKPLNPDIFCGTSVGAFNCAFLVSHWKSRGTAAIGDLEDLWLNYLTDNPGTSDYGVFRLRLLDPRSFLDPRAYFPNPLKPVGLFAGDAFRLGAEALQRAYALVAGRDAPLLERAIETLNISSIIDRSPLERTLKKWINFGEIRESDRILRIAATNWATGKVKIFHNYEMTDKLGLQAVLASTAIPGIFPQTKVGSQPFLDGGVVLNTPLEPAITAGATHLHIIYLSADVKKMPLALMENTMTTVLRQQFITWARACHVEIESIRSTNKKARLIEELREKLNKEQLTDKQAGDLLSVLPTARKEPREYEKHRKLVIHRYYPHESLSGILGMLDFSRGSIEERIERGFNDASNYDPWVNQAVGAFDKGQPAYDENEPRKEEKLEQHIIDTLRAK